MSAEGFPFLSDRLERALRRAAVSHRGQVRRGSDVPYVQHVFAVAMILDRHGFSEETVIAGLLHDSVEDTEVTLAHVEAEFGAYVADLVSYCSEEKTDAQGVKRPWIDRKRDHLVALATAPTDARAIVLADKLHNLRSIQFDLDEGRTVWDTFHADRGQVLWYYRAAIEVLDNGEPTLKPLADACRALVATLT
jgi:(p)ppGpp synthase/HD superfamily hydrolase